jgi:hypothetical protein
VNAGRETWFHVSSIANRESIRTYGLDWDRMGAARGIAGSEQPEAEGVFLCRNQSDVDFMLHINNTGGPVDIWAVDGIDPRLMINNGNGLYYFPGRIPPVLLTLIEGPLTQDNHSRRRPGVPRRKQQRRRR